MKKMVFAAVAAASLTAPATAAVVTRTVNLSVPQTTDGLFINLVTGATSTAESTAPAGWDVNPWGSTALKFYFSGANAPTGGVTSASGVYLDLAAGAVIGASSTFGNSAQDLAAAAFQTAGNHIFGLRFFNEATQQTNYGYLNLRTGTTGGTPATLVSYSYESSGASITVAANATPAVPEPATWAMMTLGFGAMGFAMRRKAASTRIRFA